MSDLAAVVLAAGAGRRLRPLTGLRPKALCPVDNVALLDLALHRVAEVLPAVDPAWVAVNAHHLAEQVAAHVGGRVQLSVEMPVALGTAGALARLRDWIDGRHVLVCNADAWSPTGELPRLLAGWDGERPRLLVVRDRDRPDFAGRWRFAGASLLPSAEVARLPVGPVGLYHRVWRPAEESGRLSLVASEVPHVDCGTPAGYLRANLTASGGRSVVAPTARVAGEIEECVVWPDAVVRRGERLRRCIRAPGGLTVPAG